MPASSVRIKLNIIKVLKGAVQMKRTLAVILVILFTLSFSACSLLESDTAGSKTGDSTKNGTTAAENTGKSGQDADNTADHAATSDSKADSTTATGKTIKATLYFATEDNSALKKEEREVQVIDGAILKACVLALIDGPKTQGLRQTVPAGTQIRGISTKDGVATVDFSKEFEKTNGLEEVVARLSVVNTLTGINGIEKVKLRIEGADMIGPSGMPLGAMGPASLDGEGKPLAGETKTITLYFSDSQAMYVVAEKRDVIIAEGDSLEKIIFEELMKGPVGKDLRATIPKDTKLLSISTKAGLCTVNLSSEFVDNSPGGTASERMTLDSVVNSLTELDYVKKVQFLIDGKKREVYTHAIFDEPFTRNEAGIAK